MLNKHCQRSHEVLWACSDRVLALTTTHAQALLCMGHPRLTPYGFPPAMSPVRILMPWYLVLSQRTRIVDKPSTVKMSSFFFLGVLIFWAGVG